MSENWCCKRLEEAFADDRSPLTYNHRFREIGIRLVDRVSTFDLINYCPFCGQPFPDSLRERWFVELRQMKGDNFDPTKDSIPLDYRNEMWWKNQGL